MAKKRQTLKNVHQASWLFGHPVLRADNNAVAYWSRPTQSPYYQKGGGWMPCLYGGVQTNNDWAAIFIPANEMPIGLFEEAQWSYYMTGAESFGVNIVIWIHDAEDFDKRAEVTQMGSVSGLEKSAGWNAHEFDKTTTQMFFYGENTTGTNLTAGTQYTWVQFQDDNLFKDWVIYRVSLEYGWQASGTFDQVWVADVKLNEVPIPLVPKDEELTSSKQYHTATSAAIATALAPKTPFRLISIDLEISAAGTTSESFTVTKDAGISDTYDVLLYTVNTLTGSTTGGTITALHIPFGSEYEYSETDEIDCAWANTENRTYGLTYTWQPI